MGLNEGDFLVVKTVHGFASKPARKREGKGVESRRCMPGAIIILASARRGEAPDKGRRRLNFGQIWELQFGIVGPRSAQGLCLEIVSFAPGRSWFPSFVTGFSDGRSRFPFAPLLFWRDKEQFNLIQLFGHFTLRSSTSRTPHAD